MESANGWPPMLPRNGASPYANTPPSSAATMYPAPDGVPEVATGSPCCATEAGFPRKGASPYAATVPRVGGRGAMTLLATCDSGAQRARAPESPVASVVASGPLGGAPGALEVYRVGMLARLSA